MSQISKLFLKWKSVIDFPLGKKIGGFQQTRKISVNSDHFFTKVFEFVFPLVFCC